jgi:hypothetical protein
MPFALMAFMGGVARLADTARSERSGASDPFGRLGVLVVGSLALAVDPPHAGYGSIEIDRLSIVYLVLAAVVCGVGWCATWIERLRLTSVERAGLALGIAVLAMGLWLSHVPGVLLGPAGLMDATSARAFFGGIIEMQPVRTTADDVQYPLDGAIAALALCWFAFRSRSQLLGYCGLCAITLVGLGAQHVRLAAYAATLSAVLLPILATQCERYLAVGRPTVAALARSGLIVLFLLAARADLLPLSFKPALASEAPSPRCSVSHLDALLAPYAGRVVLALPDDTPELLYRTRILTVGSFYHRNPAALLRTRAAWRSLPSTQEPDALRRTSAAAVLFCPHTGRSSLAFDLPTDTLLDQLAHGEVPRWLSKEAVEPASGNVLCRIEK